MDSTRCSVEPKGQRLKEGWPGVQRQDQWATGRMSSEDACHVQGEQAVQRSKAVQCLD